MGTLAHTTTSNGIECSSTDWTGASTHLIGGVAGLDIITTAETQTLTSKTLTSPVIQGTVTAGAGLTMPAFSVGANYISFGASGTTTYNHRLVWRDETYLALQDGDGGYDAGLFLSELRFDVSTAAPTYGVLLSKSGDDYGVEFAGYTTAGIGEYERVAYLNGGSRVASRRPTFDITRGKLTGELVGNSQAITGLSSVAIGSNTASAGLVRLQNNNFIASRNAANDGDVNIVRVNTSNRAEIGAALQLPGVLYITKRAEADSDVAGLGQLWIKNTTPCQLWYTDDAGADTQIV